MQAKEEGFSIDIERGRAVIRSNNGLLYNYVYGIPVDFLEEAINAYRKVGGK